MNKRAVLCFVLLASVVSPFVTYFLPSCINGRVEVFMLWLPYWTLVKDGVNAMYVQGSNANF